jgi:DNA-binding NarL/FixJ family response regulator
LEVPVFGNGVDLPNVVLMDIAMPGLNGLEGTCARRHEILCGEGVYLSMHANEEYALETHRAGACGYLLKEGAVAELELALRAVLLTNYVSGSGHAKIKFLTNDDVHRLIP